MQSVMKDLSQVLGFTTLKSNLCLPKIKISLASEDTVGGNSFLLHKNFIALLSQATYPTGSKDPFSWNLGQG